MSALVRKDRRTVEAFRFSRQYQNARPVPFLLQSGLGPGAVVYLENTDTTWFVSNDAKWVAPCC